MKNTLAALAILLVVTQVAVAEDPESRRMCLSLLSDAIAASGDLLSGFKKPGLSILTHTFRAKTDALHCLFLSGENALLYAASIRGHGFAFTLKTDSVFEIPPRRQ